MLLVLLRLEVSRVAGTFDFRDVRRTNGLVKDCFPVDAREPLVILDVIWTALRSWKRDAGFDSRIIAMMKRTDSCLFFDVSV